MMKAKKSQPTDVEAQSSSRQELDQVLSGLAEFLGAQANLRARVETLRSRLSQDRFQLAVLGQFKRGKSTLINALLGASLLPVGVVPLTAVPIFVSWGTVARVRVTFAGGRPPEECGSEDPDAIRAFLARFVAEDANPKNEIGVERVDLLYPASLLSSGIVLIDTPGVGSTHRHNTDAALRVLPECDAALFVVSVDPPITEVELEYLKQIRPHATRLLFILNKIDYLQAPERTQMIDFLLKTLKQNELWDETTRIFALSAQEGLDAKEGNDRAGLTFSGLLAIEQHLTGELSEQKVRLLRFAIRDKTNQIISEAEAEIGLRIRALETPVDDLARRCQSFQDALASIEQQKLATHDSLQGQQQRLRALLEEQIERLRTEVRNKLEPQISSLTDNESSADAGASLAGIFDSARRDFSRSFDEHFRAALQQHQSRFAGLIDAVRRLAGTIFEAPFPPFAEPEAFSLGADPYWVTEKIRTTLLPVRAGLLDRFLPAAMRAGKRRERLLHNLDELVLRNAENLRWSMLRGIDESFRRASVYFERQLDEAIATTNGIVHEALARQQTDAPNVGRELQALARRRNLLSELQGCLSSAAEPRTAELEPSKQGP
jgi:GTP-binding protein EngB required for normal cell division